MITSCQKLIWGKKKPGKTRSPQKQWPTIHPVDSVREINLSKESALEKKKTNTGNLYQQGTIFDL